MGRNVPAVILFRSFVALLLVCLSVDASWGQLVPSSFTCNSATTVNCNSATVTITADLNGYPDGRWYSCKTFRGSSQDTCCGYSQINNNERCIEIIVTLDPGAQGVVFEKPGASDALWQVDRSHPNAPSSPGSGPSGSEAYRIDCGSTTYAPGEIACLTPAQIAAGTVTFTFCKPGNDEQVYRIRSIQGNISTGNLVIQQGACGGDISISPTNIDLSTLTWNSTQHSSYNSFLSSLTDTMITVSVPNGADLSNARWVSGVPYLDYEVCGYPNGHSVCGSIDSVCGIASIAIVQPPALPPADIIVCPEDPYYVEITHTDRDDFDYWWFDGPNGSGGQVASGNGTFSHTYTTSGVKSVVFRDPTVTNIDPNLDPDCTRDTLNITISLHPVPPASINDPGLICSYDPTVGDGGINYSFNTPSVSGATYLWEFYENPPGPTPFETSTSRTPSVEFNTCGDKFVSLTVTSDQGCDSTITRVIQADSLAPDTSNCTLLNPVVECAGAALNEAAVDAWNDQNIAALEACVIEDCNFVVTDDYDFDNNFVQNTTCDITTLSGHITVTYTISDGCHSVNMQATFTIVDNTPPVVNDPDLDDVTLPCILSIPAPEANITLEEDCGTASFSFDKDSIVGSPCNNYHVVRIYILTDACGNDTVFHQTFTLDDDEAPTITCPADFSIEACGPDTLLVETGLAFSTTQVDITTDAVNGVIPGLTVSDNCGIEFVYYIDVQTGDCPGNANASVTRTFTVIDSCGLQDQCTQDITITDTQGPVLDCGAITDLYIQCGDDYTALITQWITDMENDLRNSAGTYDPCGDPLTFSHDWDGTSRPVVSCDSSSGMVVTFTLTDPCGNPSNCTATVYVYDDIPPVVTCLGGGTVACFGDLLDIIEVDSSIILVTTMDNCDNGFTVDVQNIPPFDNCPQANIVITYVVTDDCGNSTSCDITYNIDNGPPVITCPTPTNFECYGDLLAAVEADSLELVNNAGGSLVTTSCGMSYTVSVGPIPTITNCPTDVTVTFTVTDSCGRTDDCDVIYTYTQIAPSITCPGNITIEACGSEDLLTVSGLIYSTTPVVITEAVFEGLNPGNPDVSDNCGIESITYVDLQTGTCPATFERTFVVTDSCGNTDQCTQIITITDTQPPVVDCVVSPLYLDCAADLVNEIGNWITSTEMDILNSSGTTDPCGDSLEIANDWDPSNLPVFNSCDPMSNGITVTFTITDSCGNPATCTGNVFLQDTIAPTINCAGLPGGTFTCFSDLIAQIQADSLAMTNETAGIVSDDCWDDFSVSVSPIPPFDNCPNPLIQMTYTITDPCGNSDFCVVDYAIDNVGPTVVCPAGSTFECYIDLLQEVANDSLELLSNGVTMACNMSYTVSVGVVPTISNCPTDVTVVFTVTDSCGRSDDCSVTYAFTQVAPTITCPDAITAEACGAEDLLAVTGLAYSTSIVVIDSLTFVNLDPPNSTVSDNCAIDSIYYFDQQTGTCPATFVRTFVVDDSCGNSDQCTQDITITDTQPPVVDCVVSDLYLDCDDDLTAEITSWIASTQDDILMSAGTSDPCGDTLSITNDWNSGVPTLNSCDPMSGGIVITFTVTDSCGNPTTCTGEVFLQDTVAPTINCAGLPGGTFDCFSTLMAQITADSLSMLNEISGIVSDDCWDDFSVAISPIPPFDNCPNPLIQMTYTITDPCGNASTCVVDYAIDNPGPTIDVCPAAGTFNCYLDLLSEVASDSLELVNGGVTVSCNMPYMVEVGTIPSITSCPVSIDVIFTVRDSCNRTDDCVVTYTLIDIDPTITCPSDIVADGCFISEVSAFTGGWAYSIDSVFMTENDFETNLINPGDVDDNCGVLQVAYYDVITSASCPIIIERTWTVFDSCLNTQNCVQTITVQDTMLPTITCPADVTYDGCSESELGTLTGWSYSSDSVFMTENDFETNVINSGDAGDNCGVLQVAYYDVITNASCPIIIERTWTVFDTCLNTQSCVQTITVQDTMLPTITCPADVTYDGCSESELGTLSGWSYSTDSVFMTENDFETNTINPGDAGDNCGVLQVVYYDVITSASCPIIIERTWTVFDTCLNTQSCVQTITVQDTMLPTITCPADVTYDGCSESELGTLSGWSYSTDSVFMTENDFESNAINPGDAGDNCGVLQVAYYDVITNASCPIVIERTWTVFDTCLNTQSCVQTITVQDTMLPTITCPADVTYDGCSESELGTLTGWSYSTDSVFMTENDFETNVINPGDAGDNCGVLQVAYYDVITNASCPIIIERTWTVFDTCLNTQNCVQTITVQDTMLPTITCPADVTYDGCSESELGTLTGWSYSTDSVFMTENDFETNVINPGDAGDNCGVLQVAYYDVITNASCPIIIERTWTVFDTCLNTQSCVQTITVQDTMLPTINCPADVTYDGCSPTELGTLTGWSYSTDSVFMTENDFENNVINPGGAGDNCGVLQVAYYDVVTSASCPIIIERTWTVFDTCLNTQSCIQTITVQDTMLPTITCPADVTYDGCSESELGTLTGWAYSTDSVFMTENDFETNVINPGDAGDNCGVLQVAYYDVVTNASCPIVIERTWTVFDTCFNTQSCVQTITVQDTMLPTITCPADVTYDGCSESELGTLSGWAYSTDSVFMTENDFETNVINPGDAGDNCGVLQVAYYDVITNASCPIIIERTWTVF